MLNKSAGQSEPQTGNKTVLPLQRITDFNTIFWSHDQIGLVKCDLKLSPVTRQPQRYFPEESLM